MHTFLKISLTKFFQFCFSRFSNRKFNSNVWYSWVFKFECVSVNDYSDFDSVLTTSNSQFTTADIIEKVTEKENEKEDDIDEDEEDKIQKNDEVQVVINIIENFSPQFRGMKLWSRWKILTTFLNKECVRKQASHVTILLLK